MKRAAYIVFSALVILAGLAGAGDVKVKQREARAFAPDGWTNSMRWNYLFQFPAGISTTNLLDASPQGWNATIGPSTNGWLFSNNCAVATGTTSYVMTDYGDGGVGPWVGVTNFTLVIWHLPRWADPEIVFYKGRFSGTTNRCMRIYISGNRPTTQIAPWTGSGQITISGPDDLAFDKWCMFTFTYNNKGVAFSTNAAPPWTNVLVTAPVLADSNGIARAMLGRRWDSAVGGTIGSMFGQSILFDRALSGPEITNLFEATKTRYGYPP